MKFHLIIGLTFVVLCAASSQPQESDADEQDEAQAEPLTSQPSNYGINNNQQWPYSTYTPQQNSPYYPSYYPAGMNEERKPQSEPTMISQPEVQQPSYPRNSNQPWQLWTPTPQQNSPYYQPYYRNPQNGYGSYNPQQYNPYLGNRYQPQLSPYNTYQPQQTYSPYNYNFQPSSQPQAPPNAWQPGSFDSYGSLPESATGVQPVEDSNNYNRIEPVPMAIPRVGNWARNVYNPRPVIQPVYQKKADVKTPTTSGWVQGSPTWRKSYTPISGQTGCYNRCRPSCGSQYGLGYGCKPSCRSGCNIRPTCGVRTPYWAGNTMVCGRNNFGYNSMEWGGPAYTQNQVTSLSAGASPNSPTSDAAQDSEPQGEYEI